MAHAIPARVRQTMVLFHPNLLFLRRNGSIYDRATGQAGVSPRLNRGLTLL